VWNISLNCKLQKSNECEVYAALLLPTSDILTDVRINAGEEPTRLSLVTD